MELVPLNDRVVVLRDPAATASPGGIALVSSNDKPRTGLVLAVGPGKIGPDGVRRPIPLEPGDRVMFSPQRGDEFTLDQCPVLLIQAEHILAAFVPEEPDATQPQPPASDPDAAQEAA